MYRITAIKKQIRLTCVYSSDVRLKKSPCEIVCNGHRFDPMLITERLVNRGRPSSERLLVIDCNLESIDFEESISTGAAIVIRPLIDRCESFEASVVSCSIDIRVIVESNDERIARSNRFLLVCNDSEVGSVSAFEPESSGLQRELMISEANIEAQRCIFKSLLSGTDCRLVRE